MRYAYLLFFLLAIVSHSSISGQNYIQDACNLAVFQEFFELNQEKIRKIKADTAIVPAVFQAEKSENMDLSHDDGIKVLAKMVWQHDDLSNFTSQNNRRATRPSVNAPSADNLFGGGTNKSDPDKLNSATQVMLDSFELRAIEKEITWYVKFAQAKCEIFSVEKPIEEMQAFPKDLKYLAKTIKTIQESATSKAVFTSGSIGSLIGVSQVDILRGIAEWSISRAQEELMQAFLRQWLETIQNDSILMAMFPSTLNMLSTSELTTFLTDGSTWKETFQQDLDRIPNEISNTAKIAFSKAGNPLDKNVEREILAGLNVMTNLFSEVGKGKNPDEVLLLLGEASYLDLSTKNISNYTTIDRSIIATNLFLTTLKAGENGYLNPLGVYELTEKELKTLWCLSYLRERSKMKIAFKLSTATFEKDFYNHVKENILKYKIKLSAVSENITGINNALETIKTNTERSNFNKEEFNTYVLLVFDLAENGMDILGELSDKAPGADQLKIYKKKYLSGYRYVAALHEGVKTKRYGMVALNAVNLLMWLNDCIARDGTYSTAAVDRQFKFSKALDQYEERVIQMKEMELAQLPAPEQKTMMEFNSKMAKKELVVEVKSEVDRLKYLFPHQSASLNKKWKKVDAYLMSGSDLTIDGVRAELKKQFDFSAEDKQEMVAHLANSLRSSSESVNKYSKLMAGIILSEDKEDIKSAIQGAAMKTGGFMVRQKSAFSASLTFYPGVEAGREKLNRPPDPNTRSSSFTKGPYVGANLPIGVEMAWGTNLNKVPIGAIGVFLQVLDLGAVLNYSLLSGSDSVATTPEFGFKQVLSPGGYLTVHLRNLPIALGYGLSFSPELRELTTQTTTFKSNALQHGFFIAVDLNVFPIYSSKKKFPLQDRKQSKSLRTAYEN